MGDIISLDKSIIPACDVETLEQLKKIVSVTKDVEGIKAFKVGFDLGYGFSVPDVVETIKNEYPDAIVIFDHQKAGTDVPFTGEKFARRMKESGVDAAILFPREDDPITQYIWTNELLERDIKVIIGGELTHKPATKEQEQIYWNAVFQGVTDFVVPGNKPDRVKFYTEKFQKGFKIDSINYSPGFVAQGGNISDAAKVAGDKWHAICGRAVYNPNKKKDLNDVTLEEMGKSVDKLVKGLYV